MATSDVDSIRQARLEKQKSRYRDRGGIFVPAETNPLLELILAHGPKGIPSPKRRSSRSLSRSPTRPGKRNLSEDNLDGDIAEGDSTNSQTNRSTMKTKGKQKVAVKSKAVTQEKATAQSGRTKKNVQINEDRHFAEEIQPEAGPSKRPARKTKANAKKDMTRVELDTEDDKPLASKPQTRASRKPHSEVSASEDDVATGKGKGKAKKTVKASDIKKASFEPATGKASTSKATRLKIAESTSDSDDDKPLTSKTKRRIQTKHSEIEESSKTTSETKATGKRDRTQDDDQSDAAVELPTSPRKRAKKTKSESTKPSSTSTNKAKATSKGKKRDPPKARNQAPPEPKEDVKPKSKPTRKSAKTKKRSVVSEDEDEEGEETQIEHSAGGKTMLETIVEEEEPASVASSGHSTTSRVNSLATNSKPHEVVGAPEIDIPPSRPGRKTGKSKVIETKEELPAIPDANPTINGKDNSGSHSVLLSSFTSERDVASGSGADKVDDTAVMDTSKVKKSASTKKDTQDIEPSAVVTKKGSSGLVKTMTQKLVDDTAPVKKRSRKATESRPVQSVKKRKTAADGDAGEPSHSSEENPEDTSTEKSSKERRSQSQAKKMYPKGKVSKDGRRLYVKKPKPRLSMFPNPDLVEDSEDDPIDFLS
ncbi:hypothetical protein C8Q75DRAFT_83908 [Abortiporus biennis]|nr:hypothetical protein C8Q75DRAFT_83908 [Abortiporus biennis]